MDSDRVCLIHVGGTIGMVETVRGLQPHPGFLSSYLEGVAELSHPEVPRFDLVTLGPLLDSSDMRPQDWVRVAQAIVSRYDDYCGFVVLHGTDTMAYTASALSFLLPGLSKPVVLTGAQLSLADVRSDGREHIITSLILAGRYDLPEVCIYFGARLLRGNRAQKVNAADFVAFRSGNFPALATAGVRIRVIQDLVRPAGPGVPSTVELAREPEVAAVRLFPGMSPRTLRNLLEPPLDAVVLETYGSGNFPSDPELLAAIREASERGVVVVNVSQCHAGRVRQQLYSTSRSLAAAGAVSGHDMTQEAALTKLFVLLGAGMGPDELRTAVGLDLAGELSPESAE